jgi:hypothetical protein
MKYELNLTLQSHPHAHRYPSPHRETNLSHSRPEITHVRVKTAMTSHYHPASSSIGHNSISVFPFFSLRHDEHDSHDLIHSPARFWLANMDTGDERKAGHDL